MAKKLEIEVVPAAETADFVESVRAVLEYRFSKPIPGTNWSKFVGGEIKKVVEDKS